MKIKPGTLFWPKEDLCGNTELSKDFGMEFVPRTNAILYLESRKIPWHSKYIRFIFYHYFLSGKGTKIFFYVTESIEEFIEEYLEEFIL